MARQAHQVRRDQLVLSVTQVSLGLQVVLEQLGHWGPQVLLDLEVRQVLMVVKGLQVAEGLLVLLVRSDQMDSLAHLVLKEA